LLIAMDCDLPDMAGIGHHLPVQESRNSKALQFRDDEAKSRCVKSQTKCIGTDASFTKRKIRVSAPLVGRASSNPMIDWT